MAASRLVNTQLTDRVAEQVRRSHAGVIEDLQRRVEALEAERRVNGMWELIARKELKEDAAAIHFANLDGNTDEEYLIRGRIGDSSTTGGDYHLEINGDDSTGKSATFLRANGTNASANTDSSFQIAAATGSVATVTFEGVLFAKAGTDRHYQGLSWLVRSGTTDVVDAIGAVWEDETEKITSLAVVRSAGVMDKGSWVELYRKAR